MRSTKPCRLILLDLLNEAGHGAIPRRSSCRPRERRNRELESIARSCRKLESCRAGAVLLAYRQDPSFYAVGQALGMHHQEGPTLHRTSQGRCRVMAALGESLPSQGADDHGRGQDVGGALARWKPKDLGYPHEVWTTWLFAEHAREHGSSY